MRTYDLPQRNKRKYTLQTPPIWFGVPVRMSRLPPGISWNAFKPPEPGDDEKKQDTDLKGRRHVAVDRRMRSGSLHGHTR